MPIAVQTNLVPRQIKQAVHALQRPTPSLRHEEPHPEAAQDGHGSKAPKSPLGRDAALRDVEEHDGHGPRVAVLVRKVKRHGPGRGQGTNAQRVQLGGEQVLHGVPAKSPATARDVNHGNSASTGALEGLGQDKVLVDTESRHGGEESGHVNHGNGLQQNASEESALAANDIDEEQGTDHGRDKLDNAKYGGHKERLVGSRNTQYAEEIRCIQGDGSGTRPLRQQLHHGRQIDTVQVTLVEEELLDLAKPADAPTGFQLVIKTSLDHADLAENVLAIGRLLAQSCHVVNSLLDVALLDEEAGRFALEEGQDEDDAAHDDVQTRGDKPLVRAVIAYVKLASIVGEIGQQDAEIDSTGEEAGAETTDCSRCDLSDIDGTVQDAGLLVVQYSMELRIEIGEETDPTTGVCPTPRPAMNLPA